MRCKIDVAGYIVQIAKVRRFKSSPTMHFLTVWTLEPYDYFTLLFPPFKLSIVYTECKIKTGTVVLFSARVQMSVNKDI